MRAFKFNISFYMLPVYFFALAISPNISGDRIGVVLLSVFILLIPAANYTAANIDKRTSVSAGTKYSFIDFLALLLFVITIYLGWQISWQFNIAQILYFIMVLIASKQDRGGFVGIKWTIGILLIGILLFSTVYLGLNQYGFNNLLRIHIVLFSSLSALIVFSSLYIAKLREYYLLHTVDIELKPLKIIIGLLGFMWLAFAIFLTTTYTWQYAAYITLAILPSIVLATRLFMRTKSGKSTQITTGLLWINIKLATGLVIFFIYFFLESTQVLQAILGGY